MKTIAYLNLSVAKELQILSGLKPCVTSIQHKIFGNVQTIRRSQNLKPPKGRVHATHASPNEYTQLQLRLCCAVDSSTKGKQEYKALTEEKLPMKPNVSSPHLQKSERLEVQEENPRKHKEKKMTGKKTKAKGQQCCHSDHR